MKSHGSSRNYKFGPKNNWRRTIWNDVLSRTAGREKTEPILYLAGPQDLDRSIAIEKGVPTQNMIAVDLSVQNIARIRDEKVPVLEADIHDVLRSWPESRPVCAVILDFCSGLSPQGIDVYDVFERAPLRQAVVAVNFMRGRDHFTNAIRESVTRSVVEAVETGDEAPHIPLVRVVGGEETYHLSEKHRALQFLTVHAVETWQMLLRNGIHEAVAACGLELASNAMQRLPGGVSEEDMVWTLGHLMTHRIFCAMRPQFYSYKSGVLTFDSVVFQSLARAADSAPIAVRDAFSKEVDQKYVCDPDLARRISAMLAVRTMRL